MGGTVEAPLAQWTWNRGQRWTESVACARDVRRVLASVVKRRSIRARGVGQADTDAIVAATEELLGHEEVELVRLDGPVLPGGTNRLAG
jgi:hypothetical protein